MKAKEKYYQTKANKVIKNFAKRNIEGFYAKNKKEAKEKIISLLQEEKSVAWGGSMTLKEIGIFSELKKYKFNLIDRAKAKTNSEKEKIYQQALSADYYLMSSNAITHDGKLVNIDGNGNRLAALIYGPKNVIIAAGMNKIRLDEESALKRIKNQAAPANSMRLNQKNPCAQTGRCHNCQTDDTICCQTVITRRSRQAGRIKVILIGEELGF